MSLPSGTLDLRPAGVFVYEIRDWADELIYIGITHDIVQRMNGHAWTATWWPEAVTLTWTEYPTRFAAAHEEAKRISRMKPRYNTLHNTARSPEPEPAPPSPLKPLLERWGV